MHFKTVFSYIDNESQMKQLAFSVQIQNNFISPVFISLTF